MHTVNIFVLVFEFSGRELQIVVKAWVEYYLINLLQLLFVSSEAQIIKRHYISGDVTQQ